MSEKLFNKVCIIGFGLIGSSISHVIRNKSLANELICGDINPEVCNKVLELDLADQAFVNLADAVSGCDLVVISVPVGAMKSVAQIISPSLMKGCVVTDTGSVKMSVIKEVMAYMPADVNFVPAHPIAGTEFSGPESGFAELFENKWCILTPLMQTELKSIEKVSSLWDACGAKIEIMDPDHHDKVLAITSHLPHLIAYTIVGTASDLEEDTKAEVIKYSASGFRDFTRIAASDPVMWRDIFLGNKEAVLDILQRFTEDLTALQRAIRKDDGDQLEKLFTRTRNVRKQVFDAGQARSQDVKSKSYS